MSKCLNVQMFKCQKSNNKCWMSIRLNFCRSVPPVIFYWPGSWLQELQFWVCKIWHVQSSFCNWYIFGEIISREEIHRSNLDILLRISSLTFIISIPSTLIAFIKLDFFWFTPLIVTILTFAFWFDFDVTISFHSIWLSTFLLVLVYFHSFHKAVCSKKMF